MAGEPPKLTVASTQNEAELQKQRALDDLQWPTREMAANLFRVTRGHGKPWELPQQIINLSEAILEATKHSNAWGIYSAMQGVLWQAVPDRYHSEIDDCYDTIISGALQVMASRLVDQRAQECRGADEMRAGVSQLEEVKEERRLRREAEAKAAAVLRKAERLPRKQQAKSPKASGARAASAPSEPSSVDQDIDPSAWKSTADYMRLRRAQLRGEASGETGRSRR